MNTMDISTMTHYMLNGANSCERNIYSQFKTILATQEQNEASCEWKFPVPFEAIDAITPWVSLDGVLSIQMPAGMYFNPESKMILIEWSRPVSGKVVMVGCTLDS